MLIESVQAAVVRRGPQTEPGLLDELKRQNSKLREAKTARILVCNSRKEVGVQKKKCLQRSAEGSVGLWLNSGLHVHGRTVHEA